MRLALLVLLVGCRSILGIEDGRIVDETQPRVAFAMASSITDENTGTTQIRVVLSEPSDTEITVDVELVGGTASPVADFAFERMRLVFTPGEVERTIPLSIMADAIEESDEDIELELVDAVNAEIDATGNQHVVSILANVLPRVQLSASMVSNESIGTVMVEVALDAQSSMPVTVDVAVSGTADQNDYSFSAGTVTFPSNTLSRQLSITILDDAIDEDDETILLTLSNPANALLGTQTVHTCTITDNDNPPAVTFMMASASSPEEDAATINVSLVLSAASGKTVTVPLTTGGNATTNTDYQVLSGLTQTFTPGQTAKVVQVKVLDDAAAEPDETATLVVGTPTNAIVGTPSTWTLTIIDNE